MASPLSGRDLVGALLLISFMLLTGCSHEKTLNWQDTSQNEIGFRIYRVVGAERQLLAQVDANVTRFVDRQAPANACYYVTAFNAAGESAPTRVVCGRDD